MRNEKVRRNALMKSTIITFSFLCSLFPFGKLRAGYFPVSQASPFDVR